ncbi:three-helix bundle dimerization domain-containing protein [Amycolatopsis thermoflava]
MPGTLEKIAHGRRGEQEIRRLEGLLRLERPQFAPGLVHEWVAREFARFDDAPVRAYIPILVERAVRARLRATPVAPYSPTVDLVDWARGTAEILLAGELPRRWRHTRGVAGRAGEVSAVLPPAERAVLVAAAWLHDIGYASPVSATGLHSLDGARFLARLGVPSRVCALVAHHSGAAAVASLSGLASELAEFPDERGPVRDALWYCDMSTSPWGEPVSFEDRMAEIEARRGPDDPVVRALAINRGERAAAVARTAELLRGRSR